jgi:hypothetical protein
VDVLETLAALVVTLHVLRAARAREQSLLHLQSCVIPVHSFRWHVHFGVKERRLVTLIRFLAPWAQVTARWVKVFMTDTALMVTNGRLVASGAGSQSVL